MIPHILENTILVRWTDPSVEVFGIKNIRQLLRHYVIVVCILFHSDRLCQIPWSVDIDTSRRSDVV